MRSLRGAILAVLVVSFGAALGGCDTIDSIELFDSKNVYQPGHRFELTVEEGGELSEVAATSAPNAVESTVSGYVDSVDADDELVWVYIRGEEGWQRKVMPLSLFRESGLDRRGLRDPALRHR